MNHPRQLCPDDDVLKELAAGVSSRELAEQTMKHVARCNLCGPALQRYLREFSDETVPENAAILRQLESSKRGWQKRLVRQVVPRRRSRWLMLVPAISAVAAAVLALAVVPSMMTEFRIRQAQEQTAAAFSSRRTTEMRLSAVSFSKYDPFPTVLGSGGGRELDEMPPELTSASSVAKEKLRQEKADPRWLQVQGRALLWAATPGSLERAEKDFEKARSEGLDTPSLEIDLAASYFERDSRAEHPNLQRSLNLLNEVLSKSNLSKEDRASALYDLAIAYERTQAWDMAVSTWTEYLKVDSTGGWASEARRRLEEAKAKIRGSGGARVTDPSGFLQRVAAGAAHSQDEPYQDVAITEWLPNAIEKNDDVSRAALQALAGNLIREHSDPWLSDLLSSVRANDSAALDALAAAIRQNGQGKHSEALEQARRAATVFQSRRIPAGEFRARIEEVNASRRILNGADCMARAGPVWEKLVRTRYHWLQARLALEIAECGNLLGAFTESDSKLHASRDLARQFDFPLLELRDIGISAGNKHLRGNCTESWRESVDGLGVYWQKSQFSPGRLYQFYSVMSQCALETGSLHAGEAFLRHAIDMRAEGADIARNPTIDGMLRLRLANVLTVRQAKKEAQEEKAKAESLIDRRRLPARFELNLQLEQAELQLEHGNADRALATLTPIGKALADNPDSFFSLRLNQTMGNALLRLNRLDDSRKAFESAIGTADSALEGIKDGQERLLWLRATDESYRGLVRVLIDQKRPEEALAQWELYRSRLLLQEQRFSGLVDGNGRQNFRPPVERISLDDPTPRLVYAHFGDGLHIWLSQGARLKTYWVPVDRQDFENSTREFAEKCANSDSDLKELRQLGARIYSIMVQPVAADIAGGSILSVELDQETYSLPMEALVASDGAYLGERYSLIYSPGTWMEKRLRAPGLIEGKESVLLIDASHSPDAGYLPGLDTQKTAISGLFPKTRVVDTTRVKWAQARSLMATSQVFHYMGHGRPDGSGTGLDYDPARPLRAKDFTPELLGDSELIVLAACSGAAGRENGLADSDNLVHAFLAGGVPAVIASHWNVDSASTSQLVVGFYRNLKNRQTIPQAVYNARIQVMRRKPHPYFWAGFTLAGRAS